MNTTAIALSALKQRRAALLAEAANLEATIRSLESGIVRRHRTPSPKPKAVSPQARGAATRKANADKTKAVAGASLAGAVA